MPDRVIEDCERWEERGQRRWLLLSILWVSCVFAKRITQSQISEAKPQFSSGSSGRKLQRRGWAKEVKPKA